MCVCRIVELLSGHVEVDRAAADGADRCGDVLEYHGRDGAVDGQCNQGVATAHVPGHLHAGDVDPLAAQDLAHHADDSRPVGVAEDHHVLGQGDLHVEAVDLDELLHL